ncbi:MAG TPA: prepilin-type N-terminal cleavage/methylation domain-containing protein [Candidatus Saccharimonadales bacterium]|nr:prepilin-type N-terminal cleavage/methylation domain-containing protein [Candidatus Saccharimonadales bacterium]
MSRLYNHRLQKGFTIVELMIALTIVSVMLLIATTVFVHLGNDYTKGINLTRTQNAARNIIDQVSQELQFSGGTLQTGSNGGSNAICIGNTRYSYVIGKQAVSGTTTSPHVLWQETMQPGDACMPLNLANTPDPAAVPSGPGKNQLGTNGKELVPDRMRLTGLCVSQLGSGYQVSVWLAYGDDDLLSGLGGTADSCGNKHQTCLGITGDQFCAVSELQTTVAARL